MAAQYGLDTPEGDVATVIRTLGRVSGPTILVGHSYGGSVITAAGTDDRVVGLVYIAALAQDADETSQSQQEPYPAADVFKYVELGEGRLWMKPEGVTCFAGDLPEEEQKLVWATHYAPALDFFSRNAPGVAWKSKPSWYIVANHDRTVQPELERFLAKRMGASTHAVDSSHVPMLSHPGFVVDVIRAAAKAVQGSSPRLDLRDMARELLEKALAAHGGLARWSCFATVQATIVTGGQLFGLKGTPQDPTPRRMTVATGLSFPYGADDQRTDFTANRIAIEKLDGAVSNERPHPSQHTEGKDIDAPWDVLDRAYFNGYALWTYLTTPFHFAARFRC